MLRGDGISSLAELHVSLTSFPGGETTSTSCLRLPPQLHGNPPVTAPRGTCAHRDLPNLGSQATPAGPLPPVSFPWESLPKAKAPSSQGPKPVWEGPSRVYMPPEVFWGSHLHAMRTQRLIRGLPPACLGQQSSHLLSPQTVQINNQSRSGGPFRHRKQVLGQPPASPCTWGTLIMSLSFPAGSGDLQRAAGGTVCGLPRMLPREAPEWSREGNIHREDRTLWGGGRGLPGSHSEDTQSPPGPTTLGTPL